MVVTIILAIAIVFIAVAGYNLGPGIGYYGATGLCLVLLVVILFRVFWSGPRRKGLEIRPEVEGGSGPQQNSPR
jgi:membrane protease YdiL (CAAX protease family)